MHRLILGGLFLMLVVPVFGQEITPKTNIIKKELRLELMEGQVVYPPFQGMPFCSGRLRITNNLGTDITRLQLNLAYNGVKFPMSFGRIPYQASVDQKFSLAGSACEGLKKGPKITVPICTLADKTTDGCASFLTYFIGKKENEV